MAEAERPRGSLVLRNRRRDRHVVRGRAPGKGHGRRGRHRAGSYLPEELLGAPRRGRPGHLGDGHLALLGPLPPRPGLPPLERAREHVHVRLRAALPRNLQGLRVVDRRVGPDGRAAYTVEHAGSHPVLWTRATRPTRTGGTTSAPSTSTGRRVTITAAPSGSTCADAVHLLRAGRDLLQPRRHGRGRKCRPLGCHRHPDPSLPGRRPSPVREGGRRER